MTAERCVVTLILILMLLGICLYLFEMFIPLSKNMDFRDACRSTLIKMEQNAGLRDQDIQFLVNTLEAQGFQKVTVMAPSHAKAGEIMTLTVRGVFRMNVITGVLRRGDREFFMEYTRQAVSRRVIQ